MLNRSALELIQKQRLDLAEQKNHDYAGAIDNIATTGVKGLATRIFDKASRLLSLADGSNPAVSESLRDTLLDLGNYADFGVSLLDGTWLQKIAHIRCNKIQLTIDTEPEGHCVVLDRQMYGISDVEHIFKQMGYKTIITNTNVGED